MVENTIPYFARNSQYFRENVIGYMIFQYKFMFFNDILIECEIETTKNNLKYYTERILRYCKGFRGTEINTDKDFFNTNFKSNRVVLFLHIKEWFDLNVYKITKCKTLIEYIEKYDKENINSLIEGNPVELIKK